MPPSFSKRRVLPPCPRSNRGSEARLEPRLGPGSPSSAPWTLNQAASSHRLRDVKDQCRVTRRHLLLVGTIFCLFRVARMESPSQTISGRFLAKTGVEGRDCLTPTSPVPGTLRSPTLTWKDLNLLQGSVSFFLASQ